MSERVQGLIFILMCRKVQYMILFNMMRLQMQPLEKAIIIDEEHELMPTKMMKLVAYKK